jgi:putative sugar O-methyltransferase
MNQIEDNDKLLENMMNDFWKQEEIYQADTFWKGYENLNLTVLRDYGLSNFLNRPNSFGNAIARDSIIPSYIILRLNRFLGKIAYTCKKMGIKRHPFDVYDWIKDKPAGIRQLFGTLIFEILYTIPNGNRLIELNDELIGNPLEKFEIRGKWYSLNFVKYFYRALMIEKYLQISNSVYFFEIGGGYGGQAEVLLKMFPQLRACLTDIPPQLYVMEQYLKSLFPGEVLGYEDTKNMRTIDRKVLSKKRVAIVAPWALNKIQDNSFENFTNQASFQEMSRETVKRYCDELHRLVTNGILLYEQREGCGAVKNPVTKIDYINYLSEFDLVDDITTLPGGHLGGDPNRPLSHNDIYVFKRKK